MLVLLHDDKVLLEKRPQTGIWGGLWCLPQFNEFDELESACLQWGIKPSAPDKMATLEHTFTHFKLQITPWWLTTHHLPLAQPNDQQRWQPLDMLAETGLPTPVQKILQGINHSLLENGHD